MYTTNLMLGNLRLNNISLPQCCLGISSFKNYYSSHSVDIDSNKDEKGITQPFLNFNAQNNKLNIFA